MRQSKSTSNNLPSLLPTRHPPRKTGDQPNNSWARQHVTIDPSPRRDLRPSHQDISDCHEPNVEQGRWKREQEKTNVVRRNDGNAFIPPQWSLTPAIVVVPVLVVLVQAAAALVLVVGAEAFLQGVPPVLAVVRCRQCTATRRSA